jgi:signal transduction histidine kinase
MVAGVARARPLNPALSTVLAVLGAATAVEWALIFDQHPAYGWLIWGFSLLGWFVAAVGVLLWHRLPGNRTGLLLVLVGATILASNLGNIDNRWLLLVGTLMAEAPIAALLHLVMAFPSGRLNGRVSRTLVQAAYASSVLWQIPIWLFDGGASAFGWSAITRDPNLVRRFDDVQSLISSTVLVVSTVLIVRRWRTTLPATERRALGMVYGYGVFAVASFPITARLVRPMLHWSVYTLFGIQELIISGVPLVFASAMALGALARTLEVGELATWLGGHQAERPSARDALATALGDPTLQLLHEFDGGATVVDADGHPAPRPISNGQRAVVPVELASGRALIVHDAWRVAPELAKEAGRVAALAIDHERLTAELLATQAEVRASRLRIVEQGEQERRTLARDLHDGIQGRLVVIALSAGRLVSTIGGPEAALAVQMRDELDAVITELRRLVHGVLPPVLVEQGLFAALEELAGRTPIPLTVGLEGLDTALSWPVASAVYFIAAEGLTNVLKHAEASQVRLELTVNVNVLRLDIIDDGRGGATLAGRGLRGMADRVATLDGVLRLNSAPGHGTRLEVRLPCVS